MTKGTVKFSFPWAGGHGDILDTFLFRKWGLFKIGKGEYFSEVPIGIRDFFKEGVDRRKKYLQELPRIDCVVIDESDFRCVQYKFEDYVNRLMNFNDRDVYLIIAQRALNYEALGQILTYKIGFQKDWPKANIKGLVIVHPEGRGVELVKEACRYFSIRTEGVKVVHGVETRLRAMGFDKKKSF